jgi:hypothetical protein
MMYLSEDPTFLAVGLLLMAGAFLVALNVSQQGKYLIWAIVALGLAVTVVVIEWLWVTDNEQIEQVVYNLRRSVLHSDVQGVLSHLAPNVQYLQGDVALSEDTTRALVEANLSRARFDFVRITDLQVSAGQQSRRGKAEFRVFTRASLHGSGPEGGTAVSTWSLGFEETAPGIWKVNRISPLSVPIGLLTVPVGGFSVGDPVGSARSNGRRQGFGRKAMIDPRTGGLRPPTFPQVKTPAPDGR